MRQKYSLIHLPESNTQNVEIFFWTSKEMGSNRKTFQFNSCNGYLGKNVWELVVVFLDFEYGIPLMDDGQCGLHQKIEQKIPLGPKHPQFLMSQIQKISKHRILFWKELVVKYKFVILYLILHLKQILQNIFIFDVNMNIFVDHQILFFPQFIDFTKVGSTFSEKKFPILKMSKISYLTTRSSFEYLRFWQS
jgi:hypothetical protein